MKKKPTKVPWISWQKLALKTTTWISLDCEKCRASVRCNPTFPMVSVEAFYRNRYEDGWRVVVSTKNNAHGLQSTNSVLLCPACAKKKDKDR